MRKELLILLFLFTALGVRAQWSVTDSITDTAGYIETDNLNNLYLIDKSEIKKYNNKGELLFRYSDMQLGNIGSVDVSYPLRPLLVYPDLNYLVILDNTLSSNRGKINLLDYNIDLGVLACSSVQNHFWIYDAMKFALIRVDENFKQVHATGNLSQILGIDFSPTRMVEFANKLYINNPTTGILIFDNFGTYIKTIPITGLSDFQISENELIYLKNNRLIRYNTLLFETKEVELPYICRDAQFQKDQIVLLTDQKVLILKNSKL